LCKLTIVMALSSTDPTQKGCLKIQVAVATDLKSQDCSIVFYCR